MRTLLIDNYDSFTFNLFQLLAEVNGREPIVVRNDEAEWEELAARGDFDNVVISPGPGSPEREADFGVCAAAIRESELPLLGVCLGHQGLGLAYGGEVGPAPEPVHGRATAVNHAGAPLFAGIPRRFQAVRYHSLCLREPLPPPLETIARADDGVPMAVAHRERPQWGVQFHPESVASEHGLRLLANFRDLSAAAPSLPPPRRRQRSRRAGAPRSGSKDRRDPSAAAGLVPVGAQLSWRCIGLDLDPERAFAGLHGASREAFWLDSALRGPRSRFSFMGDAGGPLAATVAYDVGTRTVAVRRGRTAVHEPRVKSLFAWLGPELARLDAVAAEADLPFDFSCGFAGYLGYELKAECGIGAARRSGQPDAWLLFADRLLAFDHQHDDVYLLCLHPPGEETEAVAWLERTERRCRQLAAAGPLPPLPELPAADGALTRLARPRERHLADVEECGRRLRAGESYELCLTNRLELELGPDPDPFQLYRQLRRANPAPFGAYLRCDDLAVLSSSPERFLRVEEDGRVEARPIKGTRPRDPDPAVDAELAAELAASAKDRAENLMIADLTRSDLGSVCAVGSVVVPAPMEVESYATVHQLVTAVRGRLREGATTLDCVCACFPPGSMTGAPKRRSVEILDRLEGEARGVYSGAIGYLGPGGAADLSVAIRTTVLAGSVARIGAGGAVVLESQPEREYEEMLLKAAAPLRALQPVPGPVPVPF